MIQKVSKNTMTTMLIKAVWLIMFCQHSRKLTVKSIHPRVACATTLTNCAFKLKNVHNAHLRLLSIVGVPLLVVGVVICGACSARSSGRTKQRLRAISEQGP